MEAMSLSSLTLRMQLNPVCYFLARCRGCHGVESFPWDVFLVKVPVAAVHHIGTPSSIGPDISCC